MRVGTSPPPAPSTVGGTVPGAGNTIAFLAAALGVPIASAAGLSIPFFSATRSSPAPGCGASTSAPYGVTANDAGDADTGPNDLQNYPVLTTARLIGGSTTVTERSTPTPNTTFRIEFFANASASADPSGFGEGADLPRLRPVVTTDGAGNSGITAPSS